MVGVPLRMTPLAPGEVSFTPEHGALYSCLDALIRKRRLEGVECAEQGHDLASKGFATCDEVDFKRVISVGVICRVCEKPVIVQDTYLYRKFRDPALRRRAEDDIVRELLQKLRAQDRNRRGVGDGTSA